MESTQPITGNAIREYFTAQRQANPQFGQTEWQQQLKRILAPYDSVRVARDTTHDDMLHRVYDMLHDMPECNEDGTINEFHHFMHQFAHNLCTEFLTPRKYAQIMLNIALYTALKPEFVENQKYVDVIVACDELIYTVVYVANEEQLFLMLSNSDYAEIQAMIL
jgi:hypothetical protein